VILIIAFITWFKKWVWSYRNDELKALQQQQGITKKMLILKYKDSDKSIFIPTTRSRVATTDLDNECLIATTAIVNDYILV